MSSDFTIPLCSCLSDSNDYTNKIHNVFNQHWTTLNNERQTLIDKIDQWLRDQNEYITKYANKQKDRINNHYNRLRPMFDKEYTENLETANAYYAAREVDLLDKLQTACRSLSFSIATLQLSKYEMEYPELTVVEVPRETKTAEERNISRRRRRQNITNDNNTENNSDARAKSPPTPVISITKQIDNQQSSKINSKKKNVQSTVDTDDSKDEALNKDQPDNKCPICYMIFPLNMTNSIRRQHVNDHYIDDE